MAQTRQFRAADRSAELFASFWSDLFNVAHAAEVARARAPP